MYLLRKRRINDISNIEHTKSLNNLVKEKTTHTVKKRKTTRKINNIPNIEHTKSLNNLVKEKTTHTVKKRRITRNLESNKRTNIEDPPKMEHKSLLLPEDNKYTDEIIRITDKDVELVQQNIKTGIITYKHRYSINPYFYFNIRIGENVDYLILNKRKYYFIRYFDGELVDVQDRDNVFISCSNILLETEKYNIEKIKKELSEKKINIKFQLLYCDTGFNITPDNISKYTNTLNELNELIRHKCNNLSLSIDLDYLACNQIIILLKSGEEEFSRVLIKHIYGDDNILFNSSTNKNCEGNGYNKLLRAATIILSPYFINDPKVVYITSNANNITSIYVFMNYFNGFVPKIFHERHNGNNEEFYNFFFKTHAKYNKMEGDKIEGDDKIEGEVTYKELEKFTEKLETEDPFSMVYLKVPITGSNITNAQTQFENFLQKFKTKNCNKTHLSEQEIPVKAGKKLRKSNKVKKLKKPKLMKN